jgi:hypothetical protein
LIRRFVGWVERRETQHIQGVKYRSTKGRKILILPLVEAITQHIQGVKYRSTQLRKKGIDS